MSSPRRPPFLLAAVPALLVGCSAAPATTPSQTSPLPTSASPVATAPSSAPATTPATTQSAACPAGEYKATGFTGAGLGAAGKVKVTDVDVTFRNGRYTFEFDEDHPVTLSIGKRTEKVRIDGEIRGSYSGNPDALTFTVGSSTGTAKVSQNGATRSFPMREVATVLAPQGSGSAVCSGNDLTLRAGALTWSLVRDDG